MDPEGFILPGESDSKHGGLRWHELSLSLLTAQPGTKHGQE